MRQQLISDLPSKHPRVVCLDTNDSLDDTWGGNLLKRKDGKLGEGNINKMFDKDYTVDKIDTQSYQ